MNQIGTISHLLATIESDLRNIDRSAASVFKSLSDYIKSVSYFKELITPNVEGRRKYLEFPDFGFTIDIQTKLKIFDLEGKPSYCNEIEFYIELNRHEKQTVLKIYITDDGYIVQNVSDNKPICQIDNDYKGKNIFEMLLINLSEQKVISL
ncbi:hypothetical protein [Pseudescherichia sp.]|uniref:hypothetical protein n=1 Tax=Pseudescherichia sp. TaxID=2055881 RepID=UPI0028A0B055|nr:hypothetical protein [Pseudescherichia sp.]